MPSKNNYRNYRNNPYRMDDMAMKVHSSAAGVLWRMRTEVATFVTTASLFAALDIALTVIWGTLILVAVVTSVFVLPWTSDPLSLATLCR
jgi:hypothetical protein